MSIRKLRTFIIYFILCVAVIFVLLPIVWLVITSFKPRGEIYMASLPSKWVLNSYVELLENFSFDLYFWKFPDCSRSYNNFGMSD